MKLRKNNKKVKIGLIIGIVALALLLVLVILGTVQCSKEQKEEEARGKEIEYITIALMPDDTTYYIGEAFDPTGTKIQVVTKSQDYTYFVDWTELTFEGFDSSATNEKLEILVSYEGYTTKFYVVVKEIETTSPILQSIEVYDFQTEYTFKKWNMGGPNTNGAKIRATYSDGSVVEDIIMKDSNIPGYDQLTAPGKTYITVQYNDGVTTVETTVEITVTN